jgi:hypothetical protein
MTSVLTLFLLALPIACIAWTVTHEELFREMHEFSVKKSETSKSVVIRKLFYLFTCEYCFSHYVTIGVLIVSGYTLFEPSWWGYILTGFALVWIANVYMSLFGLLRVDMKKTRQEANILEKKK